MKERRVYCIEKEEYDWDSVKAGSAILIAWLGASLIALTGDWDYVNGMTEASIYITLGLAVFLIFYGTHKRKKLVKIEKKRRMRYDERRP